MGTSTTTQFLESIILVVTALVVGADRSIHLRNSIRLPSFELGCLRSLGNVPAKNIQQVVGLVVLLIHSMDLHRIISTTVVVMGKITQSGVEPGT